MDQNVSSGLAALGMGFFLAIGALIGVAVVVHCRAREYFVEGDPVPPRLIRFAAQYCNVDAKELQASFKDTIPLVDQVQIFFPCEGAVVELRSMSAFIHMCYALYPKAETQCPKQFLVKGARPGVARPYYLLHDHQNGWRIAVSQALSGPSGWNVTDKNGATMVVKADTPRDFLREMAEVCRFQTRDAWQEHWIKRFKDSRPGLSLLEEKALSSGHPESDGIHLTAFLFSHKPDLAAYLKEARGEAA